MAAQSVALHPFLLPSLICFAIVVSTRSVSADHPSHPITADLGPGNEDFENALLDFDGFSDFENSVARVQGFDLSGRDLRMAQLHLYEFELRDVRFDRANLTGADLEETSFRNCSFRSALLRKVCLAGSAYLGPHCDLTGADISGSWIWMTKEQLLSTRNYQGKDLSRTVLEGDFHGVSFAKSNLRGARFVGCNLQGCDFSDADISRCRIRLSKQQLCSTKNYKRHNLDGIHFLGCDFRGADLSDQNLGYLDRCDLTGADLTNASLSSAPAAMEHLLPNPRPSTGFSDCQLSAEQFYSTRTHKSGKLPPHSGFDNMDLEGWDFSGMALHDVGFPQCSLQGANLTGSRGGLFEHAEGLTVDQARSTYLVKHGKLDDTGFTLPEEIEKTLRAEDGQGAD